MKLTVFNVFTRVDEGTRQELDWLKMKLIVTTTVRGKPKHEPLYIEGSVLLFPTGWLRTLLEHQRAGAPAGNVPAPTVFLTRDARVRPTWPGPDGAPTSEPRWDQDLSWLYDYQRRGVETAVRMGQGGIILPTGGGKTNLAVALHILLPCNTLFLVDGISLLDQTLRTYHERTGKLAGKIGAGSWSTGAFTVATVQSIDAQWIPATKDEPGHWTPQAQRLLDSVQAVTCDECFPAGTLVDNRPIETVRVGETVRAFNPATRAFSLQKVTRRFASRPSSLVRLTMSNGTTVACTPDHPFLTDGGWIGADQLCGSVVYMVPHGTGSSDPGVQTVRSSLPTHAPRSAPPRSGTLESRVFAGMQAEMAIGACSRGNAAVLRNARAAHADEESDLGSADQGEGGYQPPRTGGLETDGPGRERERPDSRAAASCMRAGLGNRIGCTDQAETRLRLPDGVQDRYRESDSSGRDRDRRKLAPIAGAQSPGREEDGVLVGVRVDRVEVLQRGRDGTFGGVCPDGIVYNLEVEGPHTYVANGYVVHNCHGSAARTHTRVLRSTKNAYYRYGLTATYTGRGDTRDTHVVSHFGRPIYEVKPQELEEMGRVATKTITLVTCDQPHVPGYASGGYQQAVVNSKERNGRIVKIWATCQKPCLVFIKEIPHGEALLKLARDNGHRAEFVWGEDADERRQAVLRQFEAGRLDVLITSNIFKQGVDIIHVRTGINAVGGKELIGSIQRLGRGARVCVDPTCKLCAVAGRKTSLVWYDFHDTSGETLAPGHRAKKHWLLVHSEARSRAYKSKGYEPIYGGPT